MTTATYTELVAARKTCRRCSTLTNPSAVASPPDSDRIGPYSLWQGNLNAPLIIVAQDFADLTTYRCGTGWPGERVKTNLTLVDLVSEAGLTISAPRTGTSDDVLFVTNAILCLKQDGMQTPVPRAYYENCGRHFLRPLVEIIRPKAIASLGVGALDALLGAYDLSRTMGLVSLIESRTTFDLSDGNRLFPMAHPSPTVLNTRRSLELQRDDWRRLGQYLRIGQTTRLSAL
jgi:uracil-DNA glycosylase